MTDHSQPERRKYHRIQKNFILEYFDHHDPLVRHHASQLKNISLGGMCLITAKGFKADTVLGIDIKPHLAADIISLEGIVLESKEKIKNMIYETRLKFKVLKPAAQSALSALIKHCENEENTHHE